MASVPIRFDVKVVWDRGAPGPSEHNHESHKGLSQDEIGISGRALTAAGTAFCGLTTGWASVYSRGSKTVDAVSMRVVNSL